MNTVQNVLCLLSVSFLVESKAVGFDWWSDTNGNGVLLGLPDMGYPGF